MKQKLIDLANQNKDTGSRYKLEIKFSRKVMEPGYGAKAYRWDSLSLFFNYGKNSQYKSSREAFDKTLYIADDMRHEYTKCETITWNGCSGKHEGTRNTRLKFDDGFNK